MVRVKEWTPEEVEKKLEENDGIIELIDVREEDEVAQGKIPEITHIPLQQIPEKAEQLDKTKQYIMVCRSGRRSEKAAAYLQEQGFNVANMVGGMLEWKGEVIS
ncbi:MULTISPECIES: rhodanese-like domain-containing protein [Clostridia]|uniref:rhodanese-like domain-containing protein n=1 Tax=Clostridia TaxID=186801 RepID=UPI000EA06463|nr:MULTISPECIES: rhodanese-like domain-containing protein [Clostridia]NBJ69317.1 rhodanese-like domain-containing protein [Roseburia sp. 1XD42-34]RKI79280.1 rhodanese-like domain-containing protein [Clostridium sp. 1xD42-85]